MFENCFDQVIIKREDFFSNKIWGGFQMESLVTNIVSGLMVLTFSAFFNAFFRKYQFQSPIKKR